MGWLNRFSVFTAGLPPSAQFNLSNNKRWTEELEMPKQWMNFLSNGQIELQAAQYLFIGVFHSIPLKVNNTWSPGGLYEGGRCTFLSLVGREFHAILKLSFREFTFCLCSLYTW